MQKLTVTVFAIPNEQYKDEDPHPSWPVLGAIRLRLLPGQEARVLEAAAEAGEAAAEAEEAQAKAQAAQTEAEQAAAKARQATAAVQEAAGQAGAKASAEAAKASGTKARSRAGKALEEAGEAADWAEVAAEETQEGAGDVADAGAKVQEAGDAAREAAGEARQAQQAAAQAQEPGAGPEAGGEPSGDPDDRDDPDAAGAGPLGTEQVLLTTADGIASGDVEVGTYVVEPLDDFSGWGAAPSQVTIGDDPLDGRVVLYPPDQKWLLLLKLWGYDGNGNSFPLPGAEVVDSASAVARSLGDGHAYVPVPLGDVTLGFGSKTLQPGEVAGLPDGGLFTPQAEKVRFFVSETPEVETAEIFYGPETPVEQSAAAQIVVVPTVLGQSGGKPVLEPLIGASATITDATPGPANIGSQTKVLASGEEIRFDNLPPASYQVTVSPPAKFRDWPVKEKKLELGTWYPRPGAPSRVEAEFHFREITVTGRVQTSDNKLVDQEIRLEIYGESGVIRKLTAKGGTFSVPLDCGGPWTLGLGLNGKLQIDGDIPLVPQVTEQPLLLPPQVNVVVLLYKYGIKGQAVDEAGNPAAGAIIDVFDDQQNGPVGSAAAGPDGSFFIGTNGSGQYFIAPRTQDGAAVKHQLVTVEPIGE